MNQAAKRLDNYEIELNSRLGKGAYGEVYLGKDVNNKQVIAVKQISIQNTDIRQVEKIISLTKNEVKIMLKLNHPNLVRLYDFKQTRNNIYLIMEYCEQGTLDQYIASKPGKLLSETEAYIFLKQLLNGYKAMFQAKVVHRDLKPANILMSKGQAKISDFGFSKMLLTNPDTVILQTYAGSPLYMAPQILLQKSYSAKADVWSLGVIFYEILYGKPPWTASSIQELQMKITSQNIIFPQIPKVSTQMKSILSRMLTVEEQNRIGWEELFTQQYFLDQQNQEHIRLSVINIQNERDQLMKSNLKKNLVMNKVAQNLQHAQQQQKIIKEACPSITDGTCSEKSLSPLRTKEGIFQDRRRTPSPLSQDLQLKLQRQEEEIKNKRILKDIEDWIIHKKNKSLFLNVITQQLFDQWHNRFQTFDVSLYNGILFILTKYQVIILYKIMRRLQTKDIYKAKFTNEQWKLFCRSENYRGSVETINLDYKLIKTFLNDFLFQADKQIKSSLIYEIQIIKPICNMEYVEKDQFKSIFNITINYFRQQMKLQMTKYKNDKDYLVLLMHVTNCLRMHQMFKFKQIDFFQYYECIEKQSSEELYEELQKL